LGAGMFDSIELHAFWITPTKGARALFEIISPTRRSA
jgi:hypothetical protein